MTECGHASTNAGLALPNGTMIEAHVAGAAGPALLKHRISGQPALYLLASIVVSLLASSAAPTPLYEIYQARWGFTSITTTLIFGVYAVAVLAALLTLGKLSDHLGRRPVLLAALAIQAVALVLFATADGVTMLFLARIVQGISSGAALGAIGAGMLDIDRQRGTLANAMAPGTGTGTGALLSGLAIQFLPAPTHLIYLVLLTVIVAQTVGVALMRETSTPTPGALASLVPEVRLPRAARGAVLTATPVLLAVWALAGLYGALGPALVQSLTGSANVVLGGLTLTTLAGTGIVAIYALRNAQARNVMLIGISTLIVGVAMTLIAVSARSAGLLFAGIAVSGIGFGAGFQGGIRTVVPTAAPHERAGVLSLLFVVSYLGLGVPAVAAGFLAVYGGGLDAATRYYGAALIALSALALVGLYRTRPVKSDNVTFGGAR